MSYPLHDMKILDFTYLLPGPYGSMMLADLGADIIKVENPHNPDMLRMLPPIVDGISAVYAHLNRGKKSLALDLKAPDANNIIYKLVKEYDIVIEQFRPGVLEKLGFGYEDLKNINQGIIYCSLTGYGHTGSYASRAGHDINYMALSGVESFSGKKSTGPSLHGIQIADIASGAKNMVIGILAAYIKRQKTGNGDYLDISITDGVFAMSTFTTAAYLEGDVLPMPQAQILNGGSIYDYYMTADGRFLSVGPIEPKFFQSFCDAIGYNDMATTMDFSLETVQKHKRDIAVIIASKPLSYWIDVFSALDACVEPVQTLDEAINNPPLYDRDMIVNVTTMNGKKLKQIANPIKFSSDTYIAQYAGVSLGYNNDEILHAIGYNENEIQQLYDNKTITKK
ncbi:MAG TPA: CaiB/BaiF CoA-transferase family protein [Spirochaetota bacterium]|nr:CaiB/BaiF CoA-transferase family protein [Spirochaetota bacterium]